MCVCVCVSVAGEDYIITESILRFGACENKQCLPVTIVDNDIIEDAETFQVTLAPSTLGLSNRFTLDPRITTVTIEDGDSELYFSTQSLTNSDLSIAFSLQWLL